MIRILFFGASVTAQSGENGFYDHLVKLDSKNAYRRLSFGSSQFDNAGFFNLPIILREQDKPDIVFFEWSTTNEQHFNPDKLSYFVMSLLHNNILPIFLLLPKIDTFKENRKSDFLLYELADSFQLPLLDLRYLLFKHLPTEIIRDIVHTTPFGANVYASKIYKFLCSFGENDLLLARVAEFDFKKSYKLDVHEINKEIGKDQYLELNFDAISTRSEITVSLLKGPFSPIINIFSNDSLIKEQSIFDPWCHYERENFTSLIHSSQIEHGNNKIAIKISDKDPDYASTQTREVFLGEKKFKIKSMFTNDITNFDFCIKNL
jgi:hypothetical protein